jgi:hypothetical protein
MADGAYRTWVVVSGTTTENDLAYLAQVDPFTGRMLNSYPMTTAGGAWGVAVSPDGAYVYAMTYVRGTPTG